MPEVVSDFKRAFPPPKSIKGRWEEGYRLMTWKELQRPLMAMIALNKSANVS